MKKSGTVAPKGFLFSAVEAAVKKPGRRDLALIVSEGKTVASGVFTTCRVKAAPVRLDMQRIRSGRGRAIVVNSGNANACTGAQGLSDAREMTACVSRALGIPAAEVYVCSTGVIGMPLPMDRLRKALPVLTRDLGKASIDDVASAIMTTDKFPKISARRVTIGGKSARITGLCKGAGMISPNMATMLCFILTDAAIQRSALDAALRSAVARSFNRITVDGDMSTNDTVLAFANGAAGNPPIARTGSNFDLFEKALGGVCDDLSRMIVRDGEGATKVVEVLVRGARSKADAGKAAVAVANSLLVKTAVYGNDANWGRIIAAVGRSGAAMKEEQTDIFFGKTRIVKNGLATGREEEATTHLRQRDVLIAVDLHLGKGAASVLTCDLTEEYIRINAEYRT